MESNNGTYIRNAVIGFLSGFSLHRLHFSGYEWATMVGVFIFLGMIFVYPQVVSRDPRPGAKYRRGVEYEDRMGEIVNEVFSGVLGLWAGVVVSQRI